MKNLKSLCFSALCGATILIAISTFAGDAKTYQVTGPILEITPTTITIQKGDDKWEIARTKDLKLPADAKVGTKVTIYYTMTAEKIEVKESKAKK
jgi:hypothetical protein